MRPWKTCHVIVYAFVSVLCCDGGGGERRAHLPHFHSFHIQNTSVNACVCVCVRTHHSIDALLSNPFSGCVMCMSLSVSVLMSCCLSLCFYQRMCVSVNRVPLLSNLLLTSCTWLLLYYCQVPVSVSFCYCLSLSVTWCDCSPRSLNLPDIVSLSLSFRPRLEENDGSTETRSRESPAELSL